MAAGLRSRLSARARHLAAGLAALAVCCWGHPSHAETQLDPAEFRVRRWTMEHGLPDNQIKAIHQTPDGSLWIGTRSGLARFADGRFTVFNHVNTPEITSGDCNLLGEDGEGDLWVHFSGRLSQDSGRLLHHRDGKFTAFDELDHRAGVSEPTRRGPLCGTVHSLTPRREGGLWIGGDVGITLFRDGWFQVLADIESQKGMDAVGLMEEPPGVLWILESHGAVYRRHLRSGETETVVPNRPNVGFVYQAIRRDNAGNVWSVSRAAGAKTAAKLMGFKNGTWRMFSDKLFLVGGNPPFTTDHFGGVWTATTNQVLVRFRDGEFARYGGLPAETNDQVVCLHVDREGNLWAGTVSSGLYCLQPRHLAGYTTRDSLAHDNTWALCEGRDGSVWIGTDGGLSRFQDGKFTNFGEREGLTRKEIRSVAEDDHGTLWVGTMSGLFAFRDGRFTKHNFPGEWFEGKVRTIVASRDGGLWVGTAVGLNRLHDDVYMKYGPTNGLANADVRVLLEDHAGNLWIGTGGGGLQRFGVPPSGGSANQTSNDFTNAPDRLKPGLQTFTTFNTTNGLSANFVWALHEDADGALWIGTEGGLNRLKDGRITVFTTREGLAADGINCILEDDFSRLWLSHDHGLFWVRKQDFEDVAAGRLQALRCVSYDDTDGLVSNETNGQKSNPAGCKTRDGRLWFPTPKGVAIIDPAHAADDAVPPLPSVEQVLADGKVMFSRNPAERAVGESGAGVPPANSAENPPKQIGGTAARTPPELAGATPALQFKPGTARVLEFRFLANTFVAPEKARFKYRLRGLSDVWMDAGSRRNATFTDLRPGDYTFEVLVANHRGVWSERAATVSFRLVPHVFQTLWFRLSTVAAVLLLGYAGVRWRFRELRKLHRLQQQSAITDERTRIAKDLHDGLGADLTRLALLADLAEAEGSATAAGHRQKLSQSSREAARTLKDMIWIANPANDTVEGLVSRICQTAEGFLGDARIRCRLDLAPQLPQRSLSLDHRRNLLLVAREALNNIVKHAAATEVCIRAKGSGNNLHLEIEDNGRGFDSATARPDGLGLASMRRRVENLGGTFDLVSRPGAGTKIMITIKLSESR